MIPLLTRLRFYLYSHATDLRKSFDGLAGIVTSALARDPTSGDVYIFLNRRRDHMKLLLWSVAYGRPFRDRQQLGRECHSPGRTGTKELSLCRFAPLDVVLRGSHEGAKRAAMIYTLVATARLHQVEPFAYLSDILRRLPDHPINKIAELLPQNWRTPNS
jgi:transposase